MSITPAGVMLSLSHIYIWEIQAIEMDIKLLKQH